MNYNFPLLVASCKSLYILQEKKMCIETEQGAGPACVSLNLGALLISCSGRFVDLSKVMPDVGRGAAELI